MTMQFRVALLDLAGAVVHTSVVRCATAPKVVAYGGFSYRLSSSHPPVKMLGDTAYTNFYIRDYPVVVLTTEEPPKTDDEYTPALRLFEGENDGA